MTDVLGKPTINPWPFYTGKLIGYMIDVLGVLIISGVINTPIDPVGQTIIPSALLMISGIMVILMGIQGLGESIRVGLPREKTTLKQKGIFQYCRNPIYVGLHLLSFAAILLLPTWWMIGGGIISIVVYHRIILAEEVFLGKRFGEEYENYKANSRRYLIV